MEGRVPQLGTPEGTGRAGAGGNVSHEMSQLCPGRWGDNKLSTSDNCLDSS